MPPVEGSSVPDWLTIVIVLSARVTSCAFEIVTAPVFETVTVTGAVRMLYPSSVEVSVSVYVPSSTPLIKIVPSSAVVNVVSSVTNTSVCVPAVDVGAV